MHYYKFNIGDYARSTRHLTNDEDLAYRRLLDMYYETEAPIPLETQWVARRIRMDVDDVEVLLNDMFIRTEEGWRHPRCDADIEEYHRQAERNRENGKRGGRPKTAIKQTIENPVGSESVASDNPVVTLTTNHKPITINHKPITNINTTPEGVSNEVFQDFVKLRKGLKAPVTETAIKALAREGQKAGMTLEQVMTLCCQNGWRGFKADWIKVESLKTQDRPTQRWDSSLEGIMNKGKELGILPKPGETEGQYRERVKQG